MKSWGWPWNPVNQFQLFAVIKPAISLFAFISVQQQMLCNTNWGKTENVFFFPPYRSAEWLLLIFRDEKKDKIKEVKCCKMRDFECKRLSYIHTPHPITPCSIGHTHTYLHACNVAFQLLLMDAGSRSSRHHWLVQWHENQYMWWNSTRQTKLSCISAAIRTTLTTS